MLFRRLVLLLFLSSLFAVGISRRNSGNKRKKFHHEQNRLAIPVTTSPPESTTTQTRLLGLTKKTELDSNDTIVGAPTTGGEMTSDKTGVPAKKTEISGNKAEVPTKKAEISGNKAEITGNKTKSNNGKGDAADVADNPVIKTMLNVKVDKDKTQGSNKSNSSSPGNQTAGDTGAAGPEKTDLEGDSDLVSTGGEEGFTSMLPPAAKQVADLVNTFLTFWGPGQAWMSIKQILFFHIFIISFYYLLVVLLKACLALINLKRTPLLIYKEVEEYKEEEPYPAPKLPPPHKDYGYEGGFETPQGEQIKYVSYHEPREEEGYQEEESYEEEGYQGEDPHEEGPYEGAPPDEGHHELSKEVFHEPPPVGHEFVPVVPGGEGGGGHQEISSYTSYAGEVRPHPA